MIRYRGFTSTKPLRAKRRTTSFWLRVDEAFLREHYSAAEISTLIEAANKVCQEPSRKSPALLLLRSPRALATTGKIGGKGGNRTLDPGIMSAVL
jgi:hypothetical protein